MKWADLWTLKCIQPYGPEISRTEILRRCRRRWEDNIKTGLPEIVCIYKLQKGKNNNESSVKETGGWNMFYTASGMSSQMLYSGVNTGWGEMNFQNITEDLMLYDGSGVKLKLGHHVV
jgi:hypothetical protein